MKNPRNYRGFFIIFRDKNKHMKNFELTYKYILEKLPCEFSIGDSDLLKELMLKNENEFLRFAGKEQFLKKTLAVYPDIDRDSLYKEYVRICSATGSAFRFCEEYNKLLVRGIQPRDMLVFICSESLVDSDDNRSCFDAAEPFKTLHKLTLPVTHEFWKSYLPPNCYGDCCYVRFTPFEDETPIPEHLPIVEDCYKIDIIDLFFPDNEPYKYEITPISNSAGSTSSDLGIDVNKLAKKAVDEFIENKKDLNWFQKWRFKRMAYKKLKGK